jgi:hypothetical protein
MGGQVVLLSSEQLKKRQVWYTFSDAAFRLKAGKDFRQLSFSSIIFFANYLETTHDHICHGINVSLPGEPHLE